MNSNFLIQSFKLFIHIHWGPRGVHIHLTNYSNHIIDSKIVYWLLLTISVRRHNLCVPPRSLARGRQRICQRDQQVVTYVNCAVLWHSGADNITDVYGVVFLLRAQCQHNVSNNTNWNIFHNLVQRFRINFYLCRECQSQNWNKHWGVIGSSKQTVIITI